MKKAGMSLSTSLTENKNELKSFALSGFVGCRNGTLVSPRDGVKSARKYFFVKKSETLKLLMFPVPFGPFITPKM